jgi:signal transduction histidine kinase
MPLLGVISMALVQGRTESALAAMRDDLAEVNRRVVAMREQVVRARAVDSLASLAAGAAHELNNPLAVISGRAQMLRGRAATSEDREALDQIVRQAHAASELVSSLLEFAEPPALRWLPIDLGAWLPRAVSALLEARSIPAGSCSVSISSDTPAVFGDPDILTRAMGELIDNAWAAMEGRPARLTIKAFGDCAEECGVVQVTDNGRGMTPDVQARALDPFFSHGPAGRRRGLGLARVQRWVLAGDGSVRIRSVLEGGTTVELRLPSKRPANRG